MKKILYTLCCTFFCSAAFSGQLKTLYVSASGNDMTADGSVEKPFATISAGIARYEVDSIANPDPEAALVNPNIPVYTEWVVRIGDNETIKEPNTVKVRNNHALEVIGGRNSVIEFNNVQGFNCDFENISRLVLKNLTVTGCSLASSSELGGAVLMRGAKMLIENCRFTNNSARSGSAIAIMQTLDAQIRDCYFDNNQAASTARAEGGVIFLGSVRRTDYSSADTTRVVIENSTFANNTSKFDGMVIFSRVVHKDALLRHANITNCTFFNNRFAEGAKTTVNTAVITANAGGVEAERGTLSTWGATFEVVNNTFIQNDGHGFCLGNPNNNTQYQATSAYLINNAIVGHTKGNYFDIYASSARRYGKIYAQGNYVGSIAPDVSEACLADPIECMQNYNVKEGTPEATLLANSLSFDRTIPYLPISENSVSMLVDAGVDSYLLNGRELVKATDANYFQRKGKTDIGAFELNGTETGIAPIFAQKVKFYPNRAHDYIYFDTMIDHVSVLDLSGKLLLRTADCNTLNIQSLVPGNYLIRIEKDKTVEIGKIIKY